MELRVELEASVERSDELCPQCWLPALWEITLWRSGRRFGKQTYCTDCG